MAFRRIGHTCIVTVLLFALCIKDVYALSEHTINVILVATTMSVLGIAVITCGLMYAFKGNKEQQPPLSSLENRTSTDLLVEENINVDGKKKKGGKKTKKSKDKREHVEEDLEHGQSAPLLGTVDHSKLSTPEPPLQQTTLSPASHTETPKSEQSATTNKPPLVPLLKLPIFYPVSKTEAPTTLEKSSSPVEHATAPAATATAAISSSVAASSNASNSPRIRTSSSTSEDASKGSFFKRHFAQPSNVETANARQLTPRSISTRSSSPSSENMSVLQDKLAKIKTKKETPTPSPTTINNSTTANNTSSSAGTSGSVGMNNTNNNSSSSLDLLADRGTPRMSSIASHDSSIVTSTSHGDNYKSLSKNNSNNTSNNNISESMSVANNGFPLTRQANGIASPRNSNNNTNTNNTPLNTARQSVMNSALRNAFLMTLGEGVNIVYHAKKGSQLCKLKYIENTYLIVEKKTLLGSKKTTFKCALNTLQRIELGVQSSPILQQAKNVQESQCLSLYFSDSSELHVECGSKKERDALAEGFRIVLASNV